jgi:hypothetical protein
MVNEPHAFHFSLDGSNYYIRPIYTEDKALLQQGFRELSKASKYFRFLNYQRELTSYQLKYLTEVDGVNHVAWGILDVTGSEPVPVGVGRFIRLPDAS